MTRYALSRSAGQVSFDPNTDLLDIDTTSGSNLLVGEISGTVATTGFDGPAVEIQDEFGHSITLVGVTERQLSFGFNVTNSFDGTVLVFGDNQVTASGDDGPNLIQGTNVVSSEPNLSGPPPFLGSPGGDQIYGLGGDDVIFAGDGADRLFGGTGDDRIYAGLGNDAVFGGDGNDFVTDEENADGGGSDVMLGGAGDDTLDAGINGDDRLAGGDGHDRLIASRGSNLLEGDAGSDTITVGYTIGGSGNDTFPIYHSGGSDTILGGDGNDSIQVSADVSQTFGGNGDDTIETGIFGYVGTNYANGGSDNDVIYDYGSTSSNLYYGLDGNDVLDGSFGNDSLFGGDGNDLLYTFSLSTLDENGRYTGISQNGGNDVLDGGFGNDSYYLGRGDDLVVDPGGDDFIDPGGQFGLYLQGGGDDTIYTVSGNDSINALGFTNLLFLGVDTTTSGNDTVQILGNVGADDPDAVGGNSTVVGGMGNDLVFMDTAVSASALFYGGAGNDILTVGVSNDSLFGGTGDDKINFAGIDPNLNDFNSYGYYGGIDILSGGDGNDSIVAKANVSLVYGGAGNDLLLIDYGQSSLFGGDGNDTVLGRIRNDTLAGGGGDDLLRGEDGSDFILGGPGADTISGGVGDDTLAFNPGDTDYLQGGSVTGAVDDVLDFHSRSSPNPLGESDTLLFGDGLPAGSTANYTEVQAAGLSGTTGLIAAELIAGAALGASTTYVFVAGGAGGDGYLFVNENANPGFEDAIILTGLGSTTQFDASDIV